MATILLVAAICFIVNANSFENVYPDNGWKPMSNEKVNELRRNFIKTPANVHFPGQRNFPELRDNLLERGNDVTIKPNKEPVDDYTTDIPERIENVKLIENTEGYEKRLKQLAAANVEHHYNPKFRRAKKIMEKEIALINNALMQETFLDQGHEKESSYGEFSAKENKTQSARPNHIYEVKESTETDLLASDQNQQHRRGYFYEPPKLKTFTNNNFTSNLFSILSNYNIRTGDKLPNYALSLRQNSRNSDKNDFVYVHVPVKIPLRYNNANHLPLDPLLAVFLSNYGHYIPGLYGYPRGFNNLYGNLAFNNIHNNKPFGSYKLFSDTDTSN